MGPLAFTISGSGPVDVVVALVTSAVVNVLVGQIGVRAGTVVRVAAGVIATATLAIPFFLEAPPIFVLLSSHVVALHALRTIEILARPSGFGPRERIARVLLPFETTQMKRAPRRFLARAVLVGTLQIALGAAVLLLAARIAGPTTPYALAGWPRWLLTAVAAYAIFEGTNNHFDALVATFGFSHPPFHRSPIRSRTLAELWGTRWNLVVSHSLKVNVFMPLARRRMLRAARFASFAASAALHIYFFAAAVGMTMSLVVGSFFVVQGALVVIESLLDLKRRSPFIGHAYVVTSFAATLPLFAEPALRAIGL